MLIGRESERRAIELLIAGSRVGESGVLLITGEAGIGKTALLEWAASQATGMQQLRATGIEAEQEVPFGGLLQLLRPLLGLIDTLPGPQAEALAGAFALRAGGSAERFAVGAGTLGIICRAAENRPLAILIDDAHLLDRPSAEALGFAGRRLLADAVLLLAAVRSGEPCALIDAGLPLARLVGLDLGSATQLVAHRATPALPDVLVDRLHRATGGNPLALLELSSAPDRVVRLPPEAPVPVPDAVARAVARETSGLDPEARTALLVAAAAGEELSLVHRALAAMGLDVTALEAAERAGLLSVDGGRARFRHPLVRSSVYGSADPDQRREVHRLLGRVLPGDDLDRRAWHLAAAATGPDEQAADLLASVGVRALRRSAVSVAVNAFERAAGLSPDLHVAVDRLVSAGEAAWLAGQVERAGQLLTEALGRATTAGARVRAQEVLGTIAARSGSLLDAREALSTASAEAAAFDADLAVVLLADAINACFYLGDSGWAMAATDRLRELMARASTVRASILGLMALGSAELLAGLGGMDPVRRSVELLTGSAELADDPRRIAVQVIGPLLLRESGTGRELVQRAVDEGRDRAAVGTLPSLLFHLARDDATTDRWPAAESEYHESIRLARETGQTTELAASLAGLGWLEARRGMRLECEGHLAESAALCDAHKIHLFRAWSFYGLGDLELGAGAVEAALGHFDAMVEFLDRNGIRDVDLSPDPERVELLMRQGRVVQARTITEDYRVRSDAKGQPWARARAQRCAGMCSTDDDESEELFANALGFHDATLDAYERAKTLLALGSRRRRARRRVEARAPLRESLDIFAALGATPSAQHATAELRATGERVQPRGAGLTSQLTPQELQIATMLTQGRSTRETASALFLSPKTVEYHLRNVYIRLGVHSRDELARVLFR